MLEQGPARRNKRLLAEGGGVPRLLEKLRAIHWGANKATEGDGGLLQTSVEMPQAWMVVVGREACQLRGKRKGVKTSSTTAFCDASQTSELMGTRFNTPHIMRVSNHSETTLLQTNHVTNPESRTSTVNVNIERESYALHFRQDDFHGVPQASLTFHVIWGCRSNVCVVL